jgi:hypothetical protein
MVVGFVMRCAAVGLEGGQEHHFSSLSHGAIMNSWAAQVHIGRVTHMEDAGMTMALITVRYRLRGPVAQFREGASPTADALAGTPGLIWKIWGFADAQGMGVSAYLFESLDKAEEFVAGPAIGRLRHRPEVAEVALELAAVDRGLSAHTGAAPALDLSPAAVRRLTAAA